MTLISISRQGISLHFEAIYKYFDPPTHQKMHSYIYIYIIFLFESAYILIRLHSKKYIHICIFFYYAKFYTNFLFYIFLTPRKKTLLLMFWIEYTFQSIVENFFFTWNQLKDILISRIIQSDIRFWHQTIPSCVFG